jgi:hypothetical protein
MTTQANGTTLGLSSFFFPLEIYQAIHLVYRQKIQTCIESSQSPLFIGRPTVSLGLCQGKPIEQWLSDFVGMSGNTEEVLFRPFLGVWRSILIWCGVFVFSRVLVFLAKTGQNQLFTSLYSCPMALVHITGKQKFGAERKGKKKEKSVFEQLDTLELAANGPKEHKYMF